MSAGSLSIDLRIESDLAVMVIVICWVSLFCRTIHGLPPPVTCMDGEGLAECRTE